MKPSRRRFWVVYPVLLASLVSGCGRDDRHAVKPAPSPVPTTAVKNSKPKAKPVEAVAKTTPTTIEKKSPALRVAPDRVRLEPGDDGVQLVAETTGKNGAIRDLTETVRWETEPEGIVAVDDDGYVRPLKSGKAKVFAVHGFDRVETPVEVVKGERAWNFAADIVPILTHAGCNAGGCHGKADGQNGFHLSLFGYDPEGDFQAITHDSGGRRLSSFDPENSLLVLKAAGRVPHAGGQKLTPGGAEYETLVAWLKTGHPEHRGKSRGELKQVVVSPNTTRLDMPGPRRLRVVARFEDGHERDVTRLAVFRLNDDNAASIEPTGRVELSKRAEVDVIVRYQSRVVAVRVATVVNPDLKLDFAKLKRRNFIDDELYKRLADLKVPPSPAADDATFLRRITLDLIG